MTEEKNTNITRRINILADQSEAGIIKEILLQEFRNRREMLAGYLTWIKKSKFKHHNPPDDASREPSLF